MLALWLSIIIMSFFALSFCLVPLLRASAPLSIRKMSTIFTFGLTFIGVSLLLYFYLGNESQLMRFAAKKAQIALIQAEIKREGSINNILKKFNAYVRAHPNDAKALYLQGKIYLQEGKISEALKVLKRAHKLAPQNDKLYSEALMFSSRR